jgi:hypothetical protein
MRAACFVFLSAALVGLSAAPAGAVSYMTGTWFGHGQPESRDSMYIDRMRPDGSWRGEYRTCLKGNASDQIQSGRWSLAGDILSLKVERVDGMLALRTDSYKILSHTAQSQKYLSLAWNFAYTPQRVADDFQMPSCELTS